MPKQKTHRASAKRFKRTGNGGLKRSSLLGWKFFKIHPFSTCCLNFQSSI